MRCLNVNLGKRSYDILIEKGLINTAGQYIKADKVAIITDSNVNHFYGDKVFSSVEGFVKKLVLPAGEETKSFESLKQIYDFLLGLKFTRQDLVVALGGGVIGDLTGLAAATALRGVRFVQIPTTLLAQVDSSVGGKVAINIEQGKNLVGAFYQPELVLIDPDCLATLDKRVFSDGMAEVIKYGCIKDKNLFENIKDKGALENIELIIERCCDIKRQTVEKDEYDTGERMLLNFGHTIGHAIERYYNYERYSHGEAVAIGMYNICLIGEKKGITLPQTAEKIKEVLIKNNLPYRLDIGVDKLKGIIESDKKSQGKYINLVFLKEIGDSVIKSTHRDEIFI